MSDLFLDFGLWVAAALFVYGAFLIHHGLGLIAMAFVVLLVVLVNLLKIYESKEKGGKNK